MVILAAFSLEFIVESGEFMYLLCSYYLKYIAAGDTITLNS